MEECCYGVALLLLPVGPCHAWDATHLPLVPCPVHAPCDRLLHLLFPALNPPPPKPAATHTWSGPVFAELDETLQAP
jgi:hypothetical protein